jgi:hypothetical protein
VLLPEVRGTIESFGYVSVGRGLVLIAGPALVEQFPSGNAKFGEDRPQRLERRHDVALPARHRRKVIGGVAMFAGRLPQLCWNYVEVLCHCSLLVRKGPSRPTGRVPAEVWAGVKLPGGQYRKRHQLAHAHLVLRQIAEGLINPRELPESAQLLARTDVQSESEAAVVHVQLGRPTAA